MMASNIMAQYVENYLDLIENSPNEIIRQITRLHEKNHLYSKLSSKLEEMMKILVEKESGLDNGKNKDLKLIDKNEELDEDKEATKKTKALISVKRYLLEIQEIADEKLSIVQSILDHLDYKNKQLDFDHRNISIQNNTSLSKNIHSTLSLNSIDDENLSSISNNENLNNENNFSKDSTLNLSTSQSNSLNNHHSSNSKRSSSRRNLNTSKSESHNSNEINNSSFNLGNNTNSNNGNNTLNHNHTGKRGVKRGVKGGNKDIKRSKNSSGKDLSSNSPSGLYEDTPIDPDEPTYCSCEQVSFGEMICCDNSACLIEWFHFSCVSLTTKPKGKWYCPNCRGDRSNIPKK